MRLRTAFRFEHRKGKHKIQHSKTLRCVFEHNIKNHPILKLHVIMTSEHHQS